MFNLKPQNLVGDTNKLLFAILTELKQLNEAHSLHPIAKDTEIMPKTVKPKTPKKDKPKKGVTNNVGKLGQTRKLSKV